MSRILIHDPRPVADPYAVLLGDPGHDLVVCPTREGLFDALALRRPDAIIYVLTDLTCDLAILHLIRRVAADLPIIVLGGSADLPSRRLVQELRPTYYGVLPLEPLELREAVLAALGHGRALAS